MRKLRRGEVGGDSSAALEAKNTNGIDGGFHRSSLTQRL